jgi:hypothetical protein
MISWRILPLLALVSLSGCSAYVERSKYDTLQKELVATKKQLEDAQDGLKKAREDAAQTKPGRYETLRQGLRVWRLDTATGTSCILLATQEDWRKPDIKRQNCQCEDQGKFLDAAPSEASRKINFDIMNAYGCFEGLEGRKKTIAPPNPTPPSPH